MEVSRIGFVKDTKKHIRTFAVSQTRRRRRWRCRQWPRRPQPRGTAGARPDARYFNLPREGHRARPRQARVFAEAADDRVAGAALAARHRAAVHRRRRRQEVGWRSPQRAPGLRTGLATKLERPPPVPDAVARWRPRSRRRASSRRCGFPRVSLRRRACPRGRAGSAHSSKAEGWCAVRRMNDPQAQHQRRRPPFPLVSPRGFESQ